MKILHTADLHLGAYVGPQCDDPMKRMENTMKCLDVLVETARQEQPDIILVAGDVFHAARVWSDRGLTEVRVAASYINALSFIAPVVVLYGTPNHDGLSQFSVLREMTPKNVWYCTEPIIGTFQTKSGPIQIAGLPGFDKGHFRAQFPGLSAEEENQVFTQQLAQIVQGLSSQVDSAMPSVFMAHHTVVGCDMGNGTHIFQANEVVLDAATLNNSAFDLVCLGHIHKAQRVEACSNPVYYAGSIDASTFNDEGHSKGFWIHEMGLRTEMGILKPTCRFIQTPAREFLTERWNQVDCERIQTANLAGWVFKDKVVRVLYTCDSETEKALDKKKLERDLYAAGAYYVSEIRPEKITAAVNREHMHEKMTPWDCLFRYLSEKRIDPGDVMKIAEGIILEAQASSPMGTTSGLFLPVEIDVHNYRSYADEKFSFEDIFFAMVNGANGSGKSSLFMDAPCDCAYEITREGELTGWIKNGEKSGSIKFTFMIGADMWRITRTRQRSGKATLALAKRSEYFQLPFGDNSNWEDHSCELMKETQQKIINLLGMDCDTFQSCVLIMQDRYGKFMEASKDDRMAVLANLLGLGVYDQLSEITKNKLTDTNREVKARKSEMEGLEGEVAAEDNLHAELLQIQARLGTAADDLQQDKNELATLQAKLVASEGYVRESVELEKELKQKTTSYTEKKDKRSDLHGRIIETETFLQNEQTILGKCAELDVTRLEIAAMDGKLQLLNDKQQRCRKLNMDLSAAQQFRKNTANTIDAINDSLKDKERLEYSIEQAGNIEERLENRECELKMTRELQDRKGKLQSDAKSDEYSSISDITIKRNRLDSYSKQAEMLENANCIDVDKASCRFLQSAKEAKGQIAILESEIVQMRIELNARKSESQKKVDAIDDEINCIGYDKLAHDTLIQTVKTYHYTKDMLAKLAGAAATAEGLKKQDADAQTKIQEYESELTLIEIDIAQLSSATNKVSALRARISELLSYEQMKMQLPKAKQFVESTIEAIGQLDADLLELNLAIGKINGRITELAKLTADMWDTNVLVHDAETRIKTLENSISVFNQQIGNITAQLMTVACKKELLSVAQNGLRQSAKQAALLTVLSEAFSQDGIPYQIIRDIVPELEAAANEILGQMTGGRMRLEFVTERVLKSNKAKEIATLEIIIIDIDHGALPYMSHSGGEKVRAALAETFALAIIKAVRVGLQLGFLHIDEPPFLDAEGVESYCAALEIIHNKYPDIRIVAISHDENMKSMFPQQLHVDMTENGSKVRRL